MLRNFLVVGLGGMAGSMARYGVSYLFSKWTDSSFPSGTFVINVFGSLLIGLLFGLGSRYEWLQGEGYLLLAGGFCGGFTTFSTFALENVNLVQKGLSLTAILYIALSVIVGILACKAGIWLAK